MNRIFKTGGLCCALAFTVLIISSCSKPQKPQTYTVEIKDMKFIPDNITVTPGDTVVWINKDMVPHDVTEQTIQAWSSSPIPPGGSWKMAVNEPADYYCSIHQVMKGKLKLK